MSGNLSGFNAEEFEPTGSFEPIPAGWYRCAIDDSAMKPTKSGNGRYLELKLRVLDGEHANRALFERLNLENENEQAVQIARGTLSAICRAVGVMRPQDSSELHGLPLLAKVAVEARKDNGEPANRVKGYRASEAPTPAAPVAASPVAAEKKSPPWGKRK